MTAAAVPAAQVEDAREHARIAIVGTGFAGIGLAMRLREQGITDFVLLEKADDVGGTWRDNTYPGCQCDVPSHLYSFSFAPNPDWSRTYSTQEEIWAYLRRCAEEHGVMGHIRFGHEVLQARWVEGEGCWHVETPCGLLTAEVLVAAQGGLSEPALPEVPGIEAFDGAIFHTAEWNHDHDLSRERVAVVGTGASAVQVIPKIQPLVERLSVFQRTPAWVLPHTDRPTTRFERTLYRRVPAAQQAVRTLIYWLRELIFLALVRPTWLTRRLERLGRMHLHRQVADPALRRKLVPDFAPGCKRLLLSNDYYPALCEDNTEVVTEGIREVRAGSIVTDDGAERAVDTIVFATGFRVTDHPFMTLVRGRDGRSLTQTWAETGMRAYLGTTVAGFPNLFLLAGPNTGIGHTSLLVMIEAQIAYVLECLRLMERQGIATVDVRADVMDRFNDRLQHRMRDTVWSSGGCMSWYLDEQGRNTTLWPDFTWRFVRATRRFDAESYHLAPVGSAPRRAVAP